MQLREINPYFLETRVILKQNNTLFSWVNKVEEKIGLMCIVLGNQAHILLVKQGTYFVSEKAESNETYMFWAMCLLEVNPAICK